MRPMNSAGHPRHLVTIMIPTDYVIDMFTRRSEYRLKVQDLLPEEIGIRRVQYDFAFDAFAFVLEHPSFPEVREGERIQELTPGTYIVERQFLPGDKVRVGPDPDNPDAPRGHVTSIHLGGNVHVTCDDGSQRICRVEQLSPYTCSLEEIIDAL